MSKLTARVFGYITLSGKVIVSDPCYDRTVWCMISDLDVMPGKYAVSIAYSDEGEWGERVASMTLIHESHNPDINDKWEIMPGTVGVDSGQCGIFDNEIYPKCKDNSDFNSFYDECCALTLGDDSGGVLANGRGAVCSSGYGDGSYCLSAVVYNGQVVAMLVDFALADMKSLMDTITGRGSETEGVNNGQ
jgi:hypothetical protein